MVIEMTSLALHIDCMEYMSTIPDKHFDLAVVDPPYGIDINKSGRLVKEKGWEYKNWDQNIPNDLYFSELSRISKNQIIWGGNYFYLPPTRCFLIWDKEQPENVSFASCELAWTSFDKSAKTFYKRPQGDNRIHPTQKPIKLYQWIYANYLPDGGRVIDTHLGSGSNRIAADKAGNIDFVGCELDKDYFEAQEKRWNEYKLQLKLFL
jgi:site-specific DNA-methyltransferase (adenine-specific)